MNSYTIIVLYKWSVHGNDIKKIFYDYNLKWNSTKIISLSILDLKEILNKFQLTDNFKDNFKIDEDVIVSSGVWENEKEAVKIIKIENNDENNDNVILIYKGIEKEFYIEFLKRCKDVSYLIRKIVDNKITFEKRTNIDIVEKLNNVDEEKKTKIKNFIIKTDIAEGFSDEFKKKWIECIKNN